MQFIVRPALRALLLFFFMGLAYAQIPTLDSEQTAFLTLINNYRAQNGAGPLQVSIALQNSSQWMSADMAAKNYFAHTDSLGRDPFTRMHIFGYTYSPAGENLAAGYSDAQSALNQWINACDPDASGACTYAHRVNMLNPSYKVLGIGRAYGATSTYRWYWSTDFGGVVDAVISISGGGGGTTPPATAQLSAASVSPNAGSGSSQTFTYLFSDSNGTSDISYAEAMLSATGGGANACFVQYMVSGNSLYLLNDAGTSMLGPVTIGSSGTLQNAQCTLNAANSSVSTSGNNLTLKLSLTFASSFAGAKTNLAYVQGVGGQNSGWKTLGGWTVTGSVSTGPPQAVSVAPNSGSGSSQAFAYLFSDAAGVSDISYAQVMLSATGGATNACFVQYQRSANSLYLLNDAGTSMLGPVTVGSSGTLQNAQCTLNAGNSSVSTSGNNLTLNLSLTFASAFAGTKTNFGYVQSVSGQNSGWKNVGSWTVTGVVVTGPPQAVSVSPSSGTGSAQTFTYVLSDGLGYADIDTVYAMITPNGSAANACMVMYSRPTNSLNLLNDAGAAFLTPLVPGSSGTAQNTQCSINGAASSVTPSGNTLTLRVSVTFLSTFAGTKTNFAYVQSLSGPNSGWQRLGTWTVPAAGGSPAVTSVTPSLGAGSRQSFTYAFTDPNGYQDIAFAYAMLTPNGNGANACFVYYDRASNSLSLLNDAGTAFVGTLAPGAGTTLQNSQCTLYGAGSSATGSGNNLSLVLDIGFQRTFLGVKYNFAYLQTATGQNSGWQNKGTWTVQ